MNRELTGKNQTYARTMNNQAVIEMLRKQDCSATFLADSLNLSNAAMSSILRRLKSSGIIKISHALAHCSKGRKQLFYSLNPDFGVFIIVELSNNRYTITLSNLKEESLISHTKEIEYYNAEIIYEIILAIKSILEREEYHHIPVKNIMIAVPGKVNEITEELQLSKQFDPNLFEENNKIITLFKTHFNVPVYMQNDTNLAIVGERRRGKLSSTANGMLAYLDNGIGASFIFKDDFYRGTSGYAGEIGLMKAVFDGKENYLDEFVSLRALKEYVGKSENRKIKTEELIGIYEKEKNVREYVHSTARLFGKKLKEIVEILDISKIVLTGRSVRFGEEYLKCVREEVMKSQNICEVEFSLLNGKSIFIGAISVAVDHLIDSILNEKVKV